MRDHIAAAHPSMLPQVLTSFRMDIKVRARSALERQVREAIEIARAPAGTILNQKEEYNRCILPTILMQGPKSIRAQEEDDKLEQKETLTQTQVEEALLEAKKTLKASLDLYRTAKGPPSKRSRTKQGTPTPGYQLPPTWDIPTNTSQEERNRGDIRRYLRPLRRISAPVDLIDSAQHQEETEQVDEVQAGVEGEPEAQDPDVVPSAQQETLGELAEQEAPGGPAEVEVEVQHQDAQQQAGDVQDQVPANPQPPEEPVHAEDEACHLPADDPVDEVEDEGKDQGVQQQAVDDQDQVQSSTQPLGDPVHAGDHDHPQPLVITVDDTTVPVHEVEVVVVPTALHELQATQEVGQTGGVVDGEGGRAEPQRTLGGVEMEKRTHKKRKRGRTYNLRPPAQHTAGREILSELSSRLRSRLRQVRLMNVRNPSKHTHTNLSRRLTN